MLGKIIMRNKSALGLTLVVVSLIALLCVTPGRSAEFALKDCRYTLALRLAYGHHLGAPAAHLYAFLPRWGFFILSPHGPGLKGLGLSLEIEGLVGVADAEDTGWELGLTPMLKLTLPLSKGVHLFLEGGVGVIGENFRHPNVPHAFNFASQIGAGLEVALAPRLGLALAYRFRHSSNAGIYRENPPFNVQFFQAGLVYFY